MPQVPDSLEPKSARTERVDIEWRTISYRTVVSIALLIVVGVAMDTMQQIEAQLVMRHYDGFMRRSRIRGRRG
jgi:uncharacterized membrane protein